MTCNQNPNFAILAVDVDDTNDSCPNAAAYQPSDVSSTYEVGEVPTNILAFRTITELIWMTQERKPFKSASGPPTKSKLERDDSLTISNALATLVNFRHDGVALASRIDANECHVTVCVGAPQQPPLSRPSEASTPAKPAPAPSLQRPSSLFNRLWSWAQNFRRDNTIPDSHSSSDEESEFGALPPKFSDITDGDYYALYRYIVSFRWVVFSRPHHVFELNLLRYDPTLDEHMNILSRFIGAEQHRKNTDVHIVIFQCYIVFVCIRQMYDRASHGGLTVSLVEALAQAKPDIKKVEKGRRFQARTKSGPALSDNSLVEWVTCAASECAERLSPDLKHFELLLAKAKASQKYGKPHGLFLYNDRTYQTFHDFFVQSLRLYQASVTDLYNARQNSQLSTHDLRGFVDRVRLHSTTLIELARSQSLRLHLSTFGPLFSKTYRDYLCTSKSGENAQQECGLVVGNNGDGLLIREDVVRAGHAEDFASCIGCKVRLMSGMLPCITGVDHAEGHGC